MAEEKHSKPTKNHSKPTKNHSKTKKMETQSNKTIKNIQSRDVNTNNGDINYKKLGEGGFGCLYAPSLKCKDNYPDNFYDKKVSKLLLKKHANTELNGYDIISSIDKYNKYYLGKPHMCTVDNNILDRIDKCKPVTDRSKDVDLYKLLIMDNGGIDLHKLLNEYIFNSNSTDKNTIFSVWKDSINLFDAIILFKKNKIGHFDIKPWNIVFNKENNKLKFIDFGFMHKYEDFHKFNQFFNSNAPPEHNPILLTSEILFNNDKPIREKKIERDKIIKYIKNHDNKYNNFFVNIMMQQSKNEFITKYKNMLDIIINNNYSITYFYNFYIETYDVYGLGYTLLCILQKTRQIYNGNFYNEMKSVLLKMVDPNVFDRYIIENAKKDFKEVLNRYFNSEEPVKSVEPAEPVKSVESVEPVKPAEPVKSSNQIKSSMKEYIEEYLAIGHIAVKKTYQQTYTTPLKNDDCQKITDLQNCKDHCHTYDSKSLKKTVCVNKNRLQKLIQGKKIVGKNGNTYSINETQKIDMNINKNNIITENEVYYYVITSKKTNNIYILFNSNIIFNISENKNITDFLKTLIDKINNASLNEEEKIILCGHSSGCSLALYTGWLIHNQNNELFKSKILITGCGPFKINEYGEEFYNLDNVQIFTNSVIDYSVLDRENGLIDHSLTYINKDCNIINDKNEIKMNDQKIINDLYNDNHDYETYYKCLKKYLNN